MFERLQFPRLIQKSFPKTDGDTEKIIFAVMLFVLQKLRVLDQKIINCINLALAPKQLD